MTASDPTPITAVPDESPAPATTEPTLEQIRAQWALTIAVLEELGEELKAELAAKEAA